MIADRTWFREGELAGMRYNLITADKILSGAHGSRLGASTGSSLDFSDYREYHPGDDLRRLDWNIYARSDRLTVKLFHEEVSPHLDIIIDSSASMALDPGTSKAKATAWLAALLWTAARNGECTATGWSIADRIRSLGENARRPSEWEPLSFEAGSDPLRTISATGCIWRRNGIRILISDLLWQGEPSRAIKHLSENAAQTIVIQLLSEADINPPPAGRWRLVDSERNTSLDIFVDAATQAKYRNALRKLQLQWRDACRKHGALFTTMTAEQLLASGHPQALEQAGILSPG